MTKIRGVWATSAARAMFTESERQGCVDDYEARGPQLYAGGAGFAHYDLPGGRTLVLAERDGKVSVMTLEEIREEQRHDQ